MLRRLLVSALTAGLAAGIGVSLAQAARVTPLIHAAEVFEAAAAAEVFEAAEPGLARFGATVAANVLTGVGLALLLVSAFAISGEGVDARRGTLWGLAGFAAFVLAPALGLPPEPPGMAAGAVGPRQVWWLLTVIATLGGLGAIVFGGRLWARAAGAALLAAPHLVGAPHPEGVGVVPPELAAQFVVASLATSALFWLVLGASAGFVYGRLERIHASEAAH